jgi:hypothetical protein
MTLLVSIYKHSYVLLPIPFEGRVYMFYMYAYREEISSLLSSSQALIDMGVSGSFIPRLPIKRVIGEGGHGLLGVISASMVIYEEYTKG